MSNSTVNQHSMPGCFATAGHSRAAWTPAAPGWRPARHAWPAWTVFLLSLSTAAEARQAVERRATADTHIEGTVTDRSTRDPLANVEVRLHSGVGHQPLQRVTNERGSFFFPPVGSGRHQLEFVHIGYATLRHVVEVQPGSETHVTVELAPALIVMEPLVVTVTRRSRLESNGFYDRRRTASGTFITREQIEARQPHYLSDLLRGVQSLRAVELAEGRGATLLGRGGCPPTYFLDGIRLVEGASLDLTIPPEHLEAIEVYGSSGVPPQYSGSHCGSIVMWSRQPAPAEARGNFWLRAVLATLFALGAYFSTR
jgi:hypothetical protein